MTRNVPLQPTSGIAIAAITAARIPPKAFELFTHPVAVIRCSGTERSASILRAAPGNPPCANPNSTLITMSDVNEKATAVRPVNTDHAMSPTTAIRNAP